MDTKTVTITGVAALAHGMRRLFWKSNGGPCSGLAGSDVQTVAPGDAVTLEFGQVYGIRRIVNIAKAGA